MRARFLVSACVGLSIAASVALAGCAGGGTPAAPTTAPVTATPDGVSDSLKAAGTALAARQTPAWKSPLVRDTLKPIETPTPAQPPTVPTKEPTKEPTKAPAKVPTKAPTKAPTKVPTKAPTPAPVRKGVANSSVDPKQYTEEMTAGLMVLAGVVEKFDDLARAHHDGRIGEDELVVGYTKQAVIVHGIYQYWVQRDFPPHLKNLNGYYLETLRSATEMADSLVLALTTGDKKHFAEAEQHAKKFGQQFVELSRRLR